MSTSMLMEATSRGILWWQIKAQCAIQTSRVKRRFSAIRVSVGGMAAYHRAYKMWDRPRIIVRIGKCPCLIGLRQRASSYPV